MSSPATTMIGAARAGFRAAYGYDAAGVWSAPGRVNLIGEHTDYNGGFVLPFAIDRRTYVALGARTDHRARVSSDLAEGVVEADLRELATERPTGWSAYPLGTAWALSTVGADLEELPGFDAHFVSDVPTGAGLSSSAAIECALAVALADHWGLEVDRDALARAAQLAENEVVGAPTGILDQSAALLTAPDAALFLDCRDGTHERVDLGFEEADLTVLVVDTRVHHAHSSSGYADRRASCERGARELGVGSLREVAVDDLDRAARVLDEETFRRVRHIVTENQRVLDTVETLRTDGPRAIGSVLVASHASLRDDFEISVPQLDVAVDTAMATGAIGARMTGGGFGGSAIAVVERQSATRLGRDVERAFAEHGYDEPGVFTVRPSASAGREDERPVG